MGHDIVPKGQDRKTHAGLQLTLMGGPKPAEKEPSFWKATAWPAHGMAEKPMNSFSES